ncbi:hypothetical protein F503_08805 [Ophiostoma piceae UAMH 11346]|uniref:Uncharacterized protein n=1 Tax=Ophiostoma piceae (strain UAMH 11346) TaxID=1262450 RepID=S3C9N7_OPHP1|nr:hypothetical protein F503_08805 [Ophiostoma piceae UAMH 11346]
MCVYGFSISEELMGAPAEDPAFCHFLIQSGDHESALRSSFVDVPCEEIDNYRCSASWSEDSGYMIFTVDNIHGARRAYFGFKDDELDDGQFSPSHRSPSYVVIPTSDTAIVMPPNIHPRGTDAALATDGENITTKAELPILISEDQSDIVVDYSSAIVIPRQDSGEDHIATVADKLDIDAPADAFVQFDTIPNMAVDVDSTATDASPDAGDNLNSAAIPAFDNQLEPASDLLGTFIQETTDGTPIVPSSDSSGDDSQQLASVPASDDDQDDSDLPSSYPAPSNIHAPSVPAYPSTWGIRNISRDISYEPNSVYMKFMIDVYPDGPASIPCHLTVDLDDNVDPMFASWFVQQCDDSDWYLSWGYNQMTDSAVATLINPDRSEEAWFGWDFVNSQLPDTTLASAGPGIVQTCDC